MLKDRFEAGEILADKIEEMGPFENPVVLALPRGGVPVAARIAERINAPLDVIIVRKLGAPFNEEFAIGALVEGEPERVVLNEDAVYRLGVGKEYLDSVISKERDHGSMSQWLLWMMMHKNTVGKYMDCECLVRRRKFQCWLRSSISIWYCWRFQALRPVRCAVPWNIVKKRVHHFELCRK